MAEHWNKQQGFNFAFRLGHLAMRAHGVVVAQRVQRIHHMAQAHTRSLLKLPGGARRLKEAQAQFDKVKQIIRDTATDGE